MNDEKSFCHPEQAFKVSRKNRLAFGVRKMFGKNTLNLHNGINDGEVRAEDKLVRTGDVDAVPQHAPPEKAGA